VNGSLPDPILALLGAATEAAALWALLTRRPPQLLARNYRGAEVVSRGGVTFAAPLLALALTAAVQGSAPAWLAPTVVAAALFAALGWLDDARGTTGVRGLRGHFTQLLRHGRVTTGLVKAVGGAGVGLGVAYAAGIEGWRVLAAGAVIALSANTINALDARPGRAVTAFLLGGLVAFGLAWGRPSAGAAEALLTLLGAAGVFLWADLGERAMLGDTGANPLGAVLGITVVSLTGPTTWVVLAAVLLGFCLAADRWSLTAWLDRLSRRRAP
jgi:UDP-N-acetylmuramyl pentapeptide phosphotransferase/UDP-N-acetylglucosamine-1-phosphate transferase